MSLATVKPAPRWAVQAPVMPRAASQRPDWSAINISETGMFVSGSPLLRPGSMVDVDIVLPGAFGPSVEIASRVQVMWTRSPTDASRSRPSGMGMRFVGIEGRMHRELKAYLNELSAYQVRVKAPPPPPPPPVERPRAPTPPPPPREVPRVVQGGGTLGSYTIIKRLGSGGMGDVFLAEHALLGRRVALKLLKEEHVHDRAALRRFYDEARLVNQISHDNIVQITDLVVGDDNVFIVMELLAGNTLREELGRVGAFPLGRIVNIGQQLCSALDAVHRAGIVHRDLKPENIMLLRRGEVPDFVKLLDFGIAKLRQDPVDGPRTMAGQVLGTPGYMAPEQLMGQPVDALSDVYSLGVVLYAMLTGEMPFQAATWSEMIVRQVTEIAPAPSAVVGKAVPPLIDAMVVRCLDRDPKKRPASACEIADLMRRFG